MFFLLFVALFTVLSVLSRPLIVPRDDNGPFTGGV